MTRWGILGRGALGSVFAAKLAFAGEDVHWVMSESRANRLSADPFCYTHAQSSESHAIQLPVHTHTQQTDLLIIAVKAYQVESALQSITLAPQTQLLTLQNGMGSQDFIRKHYPQNTLWAGVTTHAAKRTSQGVCHTGDGITQVGLYHRAPSPSAPDWITELEQAMTNTQYQLDIIPFLWRKLLINSVINPLTALEQCSNGTLLEPSYQPLIRELTEELTLVANACGQNFHAAEILAIIRDVCQTTAANHSSMAEDVRNHRRTEIEFINGYIKRQARQQGIETPINDYLYQQIS
ncbi:ketopantoate reductase family protein [Celerinatantimonas sp. YJH-8]|uniref:ketopantoate reductase family protein n=1 Tax=Celerinatantimonas sp. YJH-8 TaxID=3228714 RepID=UPI0038C49923